jgi:uncharacterized protein (TIGR04255 family)
MNERRHYSQAPITEALIDIKTSSVEEIALTSLQELAVNLNDNYPHRDDYLFLEGQIVSGPSIKTTAQQTQIGYIYSSADRKQILSTAFNSFTFSRLAPYDCWESFRDEAKHLWNIYSAKTKPDTITRIATRYINRIDIPLPVFDLKHFLRTVPEVSPDLPQGLSGYFMQLQIPQEDIQATVVINQGLLPPSNSEISSILLDIEVFQEHSLVIEDTFWENIEILHTKLNSVFESCITDKVRELIK